MVDLELEILRALVTGGFIVYVYWMGRKQDAHRLRGWSLILSGFAVFFLGSLVGMSVEETLDPEATRDAAARVLRVREVGDLIGFGLVFVGFGLWLPRLGSQKIRFQRRLLERKREAENRRKDARLAHDSRIALISELVATMAHELRQPLGAIANFAGACNRALADHKDSDQLRKWTTNIGKAVEQANAILERMRSFTSRAKPKLTAIELNDVLGEALEMLDAETRKIELEVELDLPQPSLTVLADQVQIQQVVVNLIRNAYDELKNLTGRKPRLVIRCVREGEMAVVSVEDNGHGLAESEPPKLFETFFTTKAGGMGMGLTISKRIVEAHGGRIWAESNPGGGATFHFELPCESIGKVANGAGGGETNHLRG